MAELDYSEIDDEIMKQVKALRSEFDACTGHLVARRMHLSRDVVKYRLQGLRDRHLVTWNDVPGSLRVTTQKEQTEAKSVPA